jgi:hypothetical protein
MRGYNCGVPHALPLVGRFAFNDLPTSQPLHHPTPTRAELSNALASDAASSNRLNIGVLVSTLAAAIAREARPSGPRCSVAVLLGNLDAADRSALLDALSSDIPAAVLGRALKAEGHQVAQGTIQRHRKGECSCDVI